MSETAHTPGPWRVAPPSAYRDGGLNIDAGPNGQADYICLAGMPDDAQAVANARLIAAAPDMLAAIIRAETEMRYAGFATDQTDNVARKPVYDAVRAAIAKAEGRT